jgi:DNA polymerase III subunit delta'
MRFSDIIGKKEIKDRLIQSVNEGRISHAQLFAGTPGTGGLPLAVAYATYIHCLKKSALDSCGVCSSCIKNKKLIHPDLHFTFPVITVPKKEPVSATFITEFRQAFLENPYLNLNEWYETLDVENKQGFISVEESLEIVRVLNLKPYESEFKIQIIWMPEKMRTDTSNKLLKIIEEPPNNTIFLLVSEQSEQLLPTIRSRTQLIKIPRLTVAELSDAIMLHEKTEQIVARRTARIASGDIGYALNILHEHDHDNQLETNFISWMRLCYDPFAERGGKLVWKELNSWIDTIVKEGREYQKSFFRFSLEAARECMLVNTGAESIARFDDEIIPNFSKFSKFIHPGNISSITHLLNRACYSVERNANPRILFLDLSLKLHRLLNQAQ